MQVLQAQLNTTPANYDYIKSDCPTTNANEEDSCYQVSAAGHAFNNFYQYMRSWQQLSTSGLPVDPTNRPPPIAVFKDNVTVQGSWVDASDVEAASRNYNRSITNVTMAMPNAGVVAAASLADNGLPQVAGTDVSPLGYTPVHSKDRRYCSSYPYWAQQAFSMTASDVFIGYLKYSHWYLRYLY